MASAQGTSSAREGRTYGSSSLRGSGGHGAREFRVTAGRNTVSTEKSWCTPSDYVRVVTTFLGSIDLDPCWNPASSVVAEKCYSLPDTDGLKEIWSSKRIYVNPPYGYDTERGTHIRDWLAKCVVAYRTQGSEVVALIPVATNTRHWFECVFGAAQAICFIREPRVKFSGVPKGAPMACAFVYWGSDQNRFRVHFQVLGHVLFNDHMCEGGI